MEAYLRRTAIWYGGVGLLTAQVARSLALPPKYFRLVINEIEVMGVRSLGVALTAAIFTGMVFAIQSAVNMARFGAEAYVGPLAALAILRELGPVLTAILVGGKVASGITAELGSMKVTEQIDALRTLGVNYVKRLIVPRLLAAVVVFPLLTVLSDAVGVLGGMIIMNLERGADMYTYWNVTTYWVVPRDFLMGVGKSFFFGGIVTLIGCYNGLRVEGGTEGLGRATTATVVHVTMGVIVSDFFLTKLFLIFFWGQEGDDGDRRGQRRLEALRQPRSPPGPVVRSVQGRDARGHGRERLREDRAAPAHRRPHPAGSGPDQSLRSEHRGAERRGAPAVPASYGVRVPGGRAVRLAHDPRERRVPAARAHAAVRRRDPGACGGGTGACRTQGGRATAPALRALGRHAQACRHRARTHARAGDDALR